MEVFWGLIRVMIWQKTCYSLFITYLIVIFEVDLLVIELWLFLSFSPRIITQNFRITWGKMTNIREYIDRVCDKVWYISPNLKEKTNLPVIIYWFFLVINKQWSLIKFWYMDIFITPNFLVKLLVWGICMHCFLSHSIHLLSTLF